MVALGARQLDAQPGAAGSKQQRAATRTAGGRMASHDEADRVRGSARAQVSHHISPFRPRLWGPCSRRSGAGCRVWRPVWRGRRSGRGVLSPSPGCSAARLCFSERSCARLNSSTPGGWLFLAASSCVGQARELSSSSSPVPIAPLTTSFQSPTRMAPPRGRGVEQDFVVRRRLALGEHGQNVAAVEREFLVERSAGQLQQRGIPIHHVQRLRDRRCRP